MGGGSWDIPFSLDDTSYFVLEVVCFSGVVFLSDRVSKVHTTDELMCKCEI